MRSASDGELGRITAPMPGHHNARNTLAAVAVNPGIIDTAMLRSCFGENAAHYEDADAWAERAAPFLLSLGPEHNGQPLSVPG